MQARCAEVKKIVTFSAPLIYEGSDHSYRS